MTEVNAKVVQILGRVGIFGECTQVYVEWVEKGETRTLRRNVRGAVRLGDILVLRECEREAKPR
jgi:small subunit ribosomal protein S28e